MTAHDAGYATGTLFALMLLVLVPIAAGVFASRRLNRTRNFENSVRWPTYIGVAASAVLLLGYCSGSRSNAQPVEINHG